MAHQVALTLAATVRAGEVGSLKQLLATMGDGVANGEEGRVGHSGALRPEAIVRPIEGDGRICHEVSADRLDETSDANMPPGAAGV